MLSSDQREFLLRALQGNIPAVAFCETLFSISQAWDDIVDQDKEYDVNKMMWEALVTLPNNPFYREHFDILNPFVQIAIVDWLDSNELCKGNVEQKAAAYVLRDTLTTIVIHCARLIGGYDWMMEISMEVRRELYNEPLNEYLGEHL